MRGYGESSAPPPLADHSRQSERAVAGDLAEVMHRFGHRRFSVEGHDRGCPVVHRLELDFAEAWWHRFFYAQPDKPERAIDADPDAWYGFDPFGIGRENYEEFRRAIPNPDTVRAMLEDYRAGLCRPPPRAGGPRRGPHGDLPDSHAVGRP